MISHDYKKLLEALAPRERENIANIHRILRGEGFDCFLVGGAVRDLVLGRPAGDLDIATNARPERMQKLFHRTIPTGLQHGTITVLMKGMPFELTTYRAESTYSDARRPDSVSFSDTLSEDLERRDFTVNALAFEPGEEYLVDEHGGLEDLKARVIRTIGSPRDRFFEDGLRPVRACRFCATLEFSLDPDVEAALANEEIQARSRKVAAERFADELYKGFRARAIARMLRPLEKSGLADVFLPGEFHERRSLTSEDEQRLDGMFPAATEARLAEWWRLMAIPSAQWEAAARNLKFAGRAARDMSNYNALLDFLESDETRAAEPGPEYDGRARSMLSAVKQTYGDTGPDFLRGVPTDRFSCPGGLEHLLTLYGRDPLTLGDLEINGRDLSGLGYKGREIGETLQALLRRILFEPELNQREELLKFVDR